MMENATVLVIGAGIGGIATAARLGRRGYQVTVVEKCEGPGGRCGRLVQNGYHFVTGPTLFLMPEIYRRTFTELGERIEDHLELRRIDPTYRLHFRDGTSLALSSDLQAMQVQLEAIEPGSFGAFLRYLEEGRRHYELSMAYLVERAFHNLREFCTPRNLLLLFGLRVLTGHYRHIGNYFHDDRLKAAFTFQDMYLGLSPFEAPAIFSLLQFSEFAHGVWFPMGGMSRIVEALVNIANKWGVRFLYNTPVAQIDVEGRRATGVTLASGRQLQADIVVANADLPYVYRNLLPDDGTADRLAGKRYSCSALMYCWGLDRRYPQLEPHHLFFAADLHRSYRSVTKNLSVADDPSFYLHAPGRLDRSLAPTGRDTLVVIVPAGHLNETTPQEWSSLQGRTRRMVLRRLSECGLSDLDRHIKVEVTLTPQDWQRRYNLAKGASHGLSHTMLQMAYFRPGNRHARYRNLYFVGASTHPGTGIPTVLISSRLVTERILKSVASDLRTPSGRPAPVTSR